ncbi:MAG: hypothetical protein RR276_00495 [Angelakisella sp.]
MAGNRLWHCVRRLYCDNLPSLLSQCGNNFHGIAGNCNKRNWPLWDIGL